MATPRARRRRRTGGARAALVVAMAAMVALFCMLSFQRLHPAATPASPNGDDPGWEHPFPKVDWEWWQSTNPDVVAWLTIPGTSVDGPVCKAPQGDEGFYLRHDAYGNPAPSGCLYIDSASGQGLFAKANAVICGHNAGDGLMLADAALYADASWAAEHSTLYIQTPEGAWAYEVAAAEVVDGAEPAKRASWVDQAAFERWWRERISGASMALRTEAPFVAPAIDWSKPIAAAGPAEAPTEHMVTLVTCSYALNPANERTLAYAVADPRTNLLEGTVAP